jgi:hypothetical protein
MLAASACGDDNALPASHDSGSPDATQSSSGGDTGTTAEAGGDAGTPAEAGGDAGVPEGSATEAGGDGGSEAAATLDCPSYCAAIMQNCTGANAQYSSLSECTNACAIFQPGTLADTSGATLGCHLYHSGLAAALPNPHCWHAGPYGFGVCGAACDNFCALALGWCSATGGFDGGAAPYPDLATCKTACAGFATLDGGAAPGAYSAAGPTSGNSLDCREYHLGAALVDHTALHQQLHCNHVGMTSVTCM